MVIQKKDNQLIQFTFQLIINLATPITCLIVGANFIVTSTNLCYIRLSQLQNCLFAQYLRFAQILSSEYYVYAYGKIFHKPRS